MIDFVKTLYIKFVSIPSVSYCSKTLQNWKYKVHNTRLFSTIDSIFNFFFYIILYFKNLKKTTDYYVIYMYVTNNEQATTRSISDAIFNYQLIIFLNVSFSHPNDGEVGYCSFLRTGKEIKFIIYVLSPTGKFQLI